LGEVEEYESKLKEGLSRVPSTLKVLEGVFDYVSAHTLPCWVVGTFLSFDILGWGDVDMLSFWFQL